MVGDEMKWNKWNDNASEADDVCGTPVWTQICEKFNVSDSDRKFI